MDFGYYYNEAEGIRQNPGDPVGGQIRGGFWVDPPPPPAPGGCTSVPGNYRGGAEVYYTCHHYGAFNTEPRMASYLGIAAGQIPQKHYFGTMRTFPPTCDWSWTETKPTGAWAQHLGINVFEGALPYRGMKVVPTWGGSMFEALMVPLFVPEETWGPKSWGVNHPLYVKAQIEHGLDEAGYGYWGFSPSNNPAGGYREYGVDMLGMDGAGYTSDQERTDWEQPYEVDGCATNRVGEAAPTEYGDGVVTPHASFLALRYAKGAALGNLAKLRENFDAYGPGGFYDAVAVGSSTVSKRYLSLDQGMIMAALGNELAGDDLREYVSRGRAGRQAPTADAVRGLRVGGPLAAAGHRDRVGRHHGDVRHRCRGRRGHRTQVGRVRFWEAEPVVRRPLRPLGLGEGIDPHGGDAGDPDHRGAAVGHQHADALAVDRGDLTAHPLVAEQDLHGDARLLGVPECGADRQDGCGDVHGVSSPPGSARA